MKQGWTKNLIQEVCLVTDYVANGSFKSLKDNVQYNYERDYAILLRTTDYVKNWKKGFVYVSKDSYKFLKKSGLSVGDIIISSVGNPGITFKVPDLGIPMTLGPNSILVRSLDEANLTHDFIYYLFNSPIGKNLIDSITTGTTQSKFNKTNFRNLSIQFPSLEEQKQIVAKLDQCFEAIDKAKANAAKNLENAKELFQSKLNDIFSQKGEGWVEKKLGDVFVFRQGIQRGVQFQSEVKSRSQVRFLRIVDYTQGAEAPRYIDNPGDKYLMSKDDIAIVRYGASTGFICNGYEGALANNLFRIIPNKDYVIKSEYLYYYLKSKVFQHIIQIAMNGVAMPAISFGLIRDIPFYIIPLEQQKQLASELDALKEQTQSLESKYQQELNSLEELKKSILQKAFEGEL